MKISSTILFISLLFNSCVDDAARDNPLDPESPYFIKEGSLSGRIIVANQTTGISSATVWNTTESISVTTTSTGDFSFEKLSAGIHRFVVTKENFTNDTFQVAIQSGGMSQIVRGLNGAPVVTFQQILTRKIDQYFPSPQYFVDIAATVTDPNSDLDSVWFGVADTLLYPLTNFGSGLFQSTIYKYNIPTNTIQWLVGQRLHIVSRDKNGAKNISEPFFVTRVIEQTATPIISNIDSLNTGFELKWSPPDVTFAFSYAVTLSQVDQGVQTVRRTYSNITSFNESMPYPYDGNDVPLGQGNYAWSVIIVDEFGNYSRSKESSFWVK